MSIRYLSLKQLIQVAAMLFKAGFDIVVAVLIGFHLGDTIRTVNVLKTTDISNLTPS